MESEERNKKEGQIDKAVENLAQKENKTEVIPEKIKQEEPIIPAINPEIDFVNVVFEKTKNEIQKVIIGNDDLIQLILAGMFTGGHILLEGVPGVAKTLTAKLIAQCMHIGFKRIQFTPDLMPSDLIGVNIFNLQKSEFVFKKGPIFSNLILIDEINRSPAKTQAALFEAMEEKQVTVDGTTYKLELPFFVIATQNPIEQEGTYKLPEAQLDRFLFKLKVGYPSLEEEINILERFKNDFSNDHSGKVKSVVNAEEIAKCNSIIEQIHIKTELINYIATIVNETRNNGSLFLGASPRASMAIMKTSKAIAALRGRDFVTPDDIQFVCFSVLNHRIILSPEKEMEGVTIDSVIKEIIKKIDVPR
ncbi:MAG: MoxR family ATPase [Flavobacteriales bacterium]|nr:MoxR family ATPase [Flavobacteriales bacterium]